MNVVTLYGLRTRTGPTKQVYTRTYSSVSKQRKAKTIKGEGEMRGKERHEIRWRV